MIGDRTDDGYLALDAGTYELEAGEVIHVYPDGRVELSRVPSLASTFFIVHPGSVVYERPRDGDQASRGAAQGPQGTPSGANSGAAGADPADQLPTPQGAPGEPDPQVTEFSVTPRYCQAFAVKGTGHGVCDFRLTPLGDCPNALNHRDHLEER